ncbi:MAG: glutathione S-transferase C-terminal domain-containing protein [Flexilinea sp.]
MSETKTANYASAFDEEKYGAFIEKDEGVEAHFSETFIFKDHLGSDEYPAEENRYHLYLAYLCPWAQRVQLVVDYLGLDQVISHSYVDTVRDARGWAFREKTGPDPINGFTLLNDAYIKSEPSFTGVPSVPIIWDKKTSRIVNNLYQDTFVDVATKFTAFARKDIDLLPSALKEQILSLVDRIEQELHFKGFYALIYEEDAAEYSKIADHVLEEFDYFEKILTDRPYLTGDSITLADISFWGTFVRLNLSYSRIFKDKKKKISDYPAIWAYANRLYTIPAFKQVVQFDYFQREYLNNNFLQEEVLYK